MKLYAALPALLLLTACGSEDKPAAPPSSGPAVEAPPEVPVMGRERRIVALGDSLFAGYGLQPGESYPVKLEAALRARGIDARIVNAGVSGDTSAGGRQRLAFVLDSQPQPPELAILELGGNDVLRGLPPEESRANLDAMLTQLDRRGIRVLLMGMLAPPNLGPEYRTKFDAIYPTLAKKHHAALVPFFLQPVMDKPDLIQPDHIHPTARGVEELVAATVDEVAGALPELP